MGAVAGCSRFTYHSGPHRCSRIARLGPGRRRNGAVMPAMALHIAKRRIGMARESMALRVRGADSADVHLLPVTSWGVRALVLGASSVFKVGEDTGRPGGV